MSRGQRLRSGFWSNFQLAVETLVEEDPAQGFPKAARQSRSQSTRATEGRFIVRGRKARQEMLH